MNLTDDHLTQLERLGYVVLADFIRTAPESHPYVEYFKDAEEMEAFLDKMSEKGSFGAGLFNDDLGEAAKQADGGNAPIVLEMINKSTRYAIISPEFYSKGFGKRTVPKEWVQRTQRQ